MSGVSHDSETPAVGQQVITACAFIHKEFEGVPKLFMPQRAMTKRFLPGQYELPGGHIDFGEDIAEGLRREIKEEFAMDIELGDPFAAFTYRNDIKGSHSIEVVYFARFVGDIADIVTDPEDHIDYGWYAEAEATALKGDDSDEVAAIRKGFAILRGEPLNT